MTHPITTPTGRSTGPSMLDVLGRTVVAGDRIAVSDVHYEEAIQRIVTVTGVRTVEPSSGEAPFEVASYQLDGDKYERSAKSREIVRIDSGPASTEVQWATLYEGLSEDDIEPVTEEQARVWASLPMFDGQDVLISRDAAYGPWRKTR